MGGRGSKGTAHVDGGAAPAAVVETAVPTPAAPSARVVDAKTAAVNARFERVITNEIERISSRTDNEWVGMDDIRRVLDERGVSRAMQDSQLRRLSSERKILLAPESNRKALRQLDHDSAVRLGGEDNHIVMILRHPGQR